MCSSMETSLPPNPWHALAYLTCSVCWESLLLLSQNSIHLYPQSSLRRLCLGIPYWQAGAAPHCLRSGLRPWDFQELDQIEAVKPFSKFSIKVRNMGKYLIVLFKLLITRSWASQEDVIWLFLRYQNQRRRDLIMATLNSRKKELFQRVEGFEVAKAVYILQVCRKGAAYAKAENELKKLVDSAGIPFLPTPMGKGLLPETHELAATSVRSLAIGKCDVALVVGARLNWLLHFVEPPKWSKDVKFILVDVSKEEIELRKPHLGLVGDAKLVLEMINKEIKDEPFRLGRSHPWVEAITKKAKENVAKMEGQLAKDVVLFNFLTPMRIIRNAIMGMGSPAPVVVSEGANTMDVCRGQFCCKQSREQGWMLGLGGQWELDWAIALQRRLLYLIGLL